jgi:alanyl-tRNA synthetase
MAASAELVEDLLGRNKLLLLDSVHLPARKHQPRDLAPVDFGRHPARVAVSHRLGLEALGNGGDKSIDLIVAHADDVEAPAVRHVDSVILAQAEREKLRLIDIAGFDLNACGGTHVRATGQIGSILLRKISKEKQGFRVEFVCGMRAVSTARKDYETLSDAAGLFSTHIHDVPTQVRKLLDEAKAAVKREHKLLEEVATLTADMMLAKLGDANVIRAFFADRDLAFIKLLAQRLTRQGTVVALLGCGGTQPAVVFAQTAGLGSDMGALMKQALVELGGRGGGNKDMAQGGATDAAKIEAVLEEMAGKIQS